MSSLATPSPSPPQSGPGPSRRPPRKSTLTQQQKNQKRQRATQEQLVVLEAEFDKCPTPNATTRERIAEQINMTERSVQIWFQNRRAKIKTLAKKSIETGGDCDAIPDSMRYYLATKAFESGKGFGRFVGDGSRFSAYGGMGGFLVPEPNQTKIKTHHFHATSLTIGSWRRAAQNTMDLVVFYVLEKACMTYYIHNDSSGYKIEYPFSYIDNIELKTVEAHSPNPIEQKQGHLIITLNRPPNFLMDSNSDHQGFLKVPDFTEHQQASQIFVHHLTGDASKLTNQLAKLISSDAFIHRHSHATASVAVHSQIPMQMPMPLYAPIPQPDPSSPHIARPASSNAMYQQEVAPAHQFHQRHRRTRSRSVPIAIDFAQLQQNMPSFNFQSHHSNDHLYAPAPQHTHHLVNAPLDSPLRIDTSANFLDYRPGSAAYPVSATTASPSDYASPSLINASVQQQDGGYNSPSPYGLPFLSPMADPSAMVTQSMSPMSMGPDPIIASGSPPLAHLDTDGAVKPEMFTVYEGCVTDDINDLYSKHTLSASQDSPHLDEGEAVDMHQMLHFIKPENVTGVY
ncbi:hypothetical protein EX30DRAFT_52122 [Ascodesmis nigricans]|uniref:Homeobox domain-containing protein n=1 Tax=Ascodesmis nigricans TaxID=341454 RepID=A0A4S2MVA0_9PEZI|nr:hypothetical protein EX30DRAFT_52122 [Ascodesmis nigricans]